MHCGMSSSGFDTQRIIPVLVVINSYWTVTMCQEFTGMNSFHSHTLWDRGHLCYPGCWDGSDLLPSPLLPAPGSLGSWVWTSSTCSLALQHLAGSRQWDTWQEISLYPLGSLLAGATASQLPPTPQSHSPPSEALSTQLPLPL